MKVHELIELLSKLDGELPVLKRCIDPDDFLDDAFYDVCLEGPMRLWKDSHSYNDPLTRRRGKFPEEVEIEVVVL